MPSLEALPKTVTRYGHTVFADPDDLIGRAIHRRGAFDVSGLELMTRVLRAIRPRRVLDIGANIGNHALAFSRFCDDVIAFEPGSRAFAILQKNLAANPGARVTAHRVGLSDRDRHAALHVSAEGNLGHSTVVEHLRPATADIEAIELRHGDRYLQELGIDSDIGFVKIDVEGHEVEVLLGLKDTITANQPILSLEWLDESVRMRVRDERLFESLFDGWDFHAVGYRTAAKAELLAKPFGRWRWRWLGRRKVGLGPFRFDERYYNVLLVPPGRRAALRGLPRLRGL